MLSDPLPIVITGTSPDRESTIKMYPNPAYDMLTIEMPADHHSYSVELFHSNGGTVLQKFQTTQLRTEWDVRGLAAGLYIVRVTHREKTEYRKFVKR